MASRLLRRTSRRSGFTLLEVAVALVIFVIGALAIIRIFPGALGVVVNQGERVAAIDLNNDLLARLSNNPGLTPDATFDDPQDLSLAWNNNVFGSVVGTGIHNNSLPGANPSPDMETAVEHSALYHFRSIQGERHVYDGSGYVLTDFPYYLGGTTYGVTISTEDTVRGVTVNSSGVLDFTNATLASDGSAFNDGSGTSPESPPALDCNIAHTYYVTYRWTSGGYVQGTTDEPLRYKLPVSGPGVAPPLLAGAAVVPGPVQVRLHIARGVQPGNQPVMDASKRGYVDMVNYYPLQAYVTFTAGQTVSFDYVVDDWRWLVDDATPTTQDGIGQNLRLVTLPVGHIDDALETKPLVSTLDTPLYSLLYTPGQVPPNYDFSSWNSSTLPSSYPQINPRAGTAVYDTGGIAGARTRTVFRTLSGWATQLSVAAKSYKRYLGSASYPAEAYRDYYWGGGDTLYFHPSEAGKAVRISFAYRPAIGAAEVHVSDQLAQISSTPESASPNSGFDAGPLPTCQLVEGNGTTPVYVDSITEVAGASVQARTAWLTADRYSQASITDYRSVN